MNFIEDLNKTSISSEDISYLNNLEERDGFKFIQEKDYKQMRSFVNQYSEEYENVIPILTDNNGNYICVIPEGDFSGIIVLLSLDESGLTRIFKDIPTMVRMINNNKNYWDIYDFPESDYS